MDEKLVPVECENTPPDEGVGIWVEREHYNIVPVPEWNNANELIIKSPAEMIVKKQGGKWNANVSQNMEETIYDITVYRDGNPPVITINTRLTIYSGNQAQALIESPATHNSEFKTIPAVYDISSEPMPIDLPMYIYSPYVKIEYGQVIARVTISQP